MRGTFIAMLALAILAPVPAARAELVGEFNAGLRGVKTWGAYTVVADARVYETSGKPPPQLTSAVIHFPRGAAVRRQFVVDRFFCDGAKLDVDPPNPALCEHAHFASGKLLLDARPAVPDPFSADLELFLGKGTEKGAVASIVALVLPNEKTPVYTFQVLRGYLFNESRLSRRFGYRLELPTSIEPLIPGVTLSLAELHLKISGLRLRQRVRRCVRRAQGSAGRCLRRRTRSKTVFWIKTPRCPSARKVTFGADYQFEGAAPVSKRRRVSCRQFLRRRTVHRKGRIPGTP